MIRYACAYPDASPITPLIGVRGSGLNTRLVVDVSDIATGPYALILHNASGQVLAQRRVCVQR